MRTTTHVPGKEEASPAIRQSTRTPGPLLRSRRGFLVFADVLWFLIYLLIVLILYLFLFRDLTPKPKDIVVTENLTNDAAFMAYSTLQMDLSSASNAKFLSAVRETAVQGKKTAEYERFLHEQFGYGMKDHPWHRQLKNDERRRPIAYAFVLGTVERPNGKPPIVEYLPDTCITEEDFADGEDLCDRLGHPRLTDPDTGLLVPNFAKRTPIPEETASDLEAEVGTSYVLADGKGYVFQVIVLYKLLQTP